MIELPDFLSPLEFEQQQMAPGPLLDALLDAARQLAKHHRLAGEVEALPGGSNFVAGVGPWNVIKIFPPFQRYQWEAEVRVLKALSVQSLPLTLPQFRADGEQGAWSYVVMSRLEGKQLETLLWPSLPEATRCGLLAEIGSVMRAMHALPAAALPALDPPWELFWSHQRERCLEHHRRQGLPEQLLNDLPAWLEAHVSELAELGPRVLLTGEYTPENLLVKQHEGGWKLTGMFDFADSMLGPARYDWLGPICFLVQGKRPRLEAFLSGYGARPANEAANEAALGAEILSYLLLHRYSNPRLQLRIPHWEQAASLDELAAMIWPEA